MGAHKLGYPNPGWMALVNEQLCLEDWIVKRAVYSWLAWWHFYECAAVCCPRRTGIGNGFWQSG